MNDIAMVEKKIVDRLKVCRSLSYSTGKILAYSEAIKIVQEELHKFEKTYQEKSEVDK